MRKTASPLNSPLPPQPTSDDGQETRLPAQSGHEEKQPHQEEKESRAPGVGLGVTLNLPGVSEQVCRAAVDAVRAAGVSQGRVDALPQVLGSALFHLLCFGWSPHWDPRRSFTSSDPMAIPHWTWKESNRAELRVVQRMFDHGYEPCEVAAIFKLPGCGLGIGPRQSRHGLVRALALAMNGRKDPSDVVARDKEQGVVEVVIASVWSRWDDAACLRWDLPNGQARMQRLRYSRPDHLAQARASASLPLIAPQTDEDYLSLARELKGRAVRYIPIPNRKQAHTVLSWVPATAPRVVVQTPLPRAAPAVDRTPPPRAEHAAEFDRQVRNMTALRIDCTEWHERWSVIEKKLRHDIESSFGQQARKSRRTALEVAQRLVATLPTADYHYLPFTLVERSSGRLNALDYSVQSIHRPLRTAIVPEPGKVFLYADFATLHVRVRAALIELRPGKVPGSPPNHLQSLLLDGIDPYRWAGEQYLGAGHPDARPLGKPVVLALSNLSGATTAWNNARDAGLTVEFALIERMHRELPIRLPLFTKWHSNPTWRWVPGGEVQQPTSGHFSSLLGRRVVYPPKRWCINPEGGWEVERPALRYRLGEAVEADAMQLVLAFFDRAMTGLDARPVLPVFDGLLLECAVADALQVKARIEALMKGALTRACPGVVPVVGVEGPMDRWICG